MPLNYGRSFHLPRNKKEGVVFMPNINKWLVRVYKIVNKEHKIKKICTIGSFKTEEEAIECFNNKKKQG